MFKKNNIENKNHNAENQSFTCTKFPENTNTSIQSSPMENLDTIIHSQPMNLNFKETTETFNSTLLVDGIIFSLHTVNTLSLIDFEQNNKKNNNNNNNNNYNDETLTNTTNNIILSENHKNRQDATSTELTQNSDPLNLSIIT